MNETYLRIWTICSSYTILVKTIMNTQSIQLHVQLHWDLQPIFNMTKTRKCLIVVPFKDKIIMDWKHVGKYVYRASLDLKYPAITTELHCMQYLSRLNPKPT
jgi:hypothetical protein